MKQPAKPTYRRSAPVDPKRPAPLPESNRLRNLLIVFVLLLFGASAYAYEINPAGCSKLLNDSRDVAASLLPDGWVPATAPTAKPAADAKAATPSSPPSPPTPATANVTTNVATAPSPADDAEFPVPAQPHWTWTTLDGKTYEDVVINKIEPGTVSITHSKGVAHVSLKLLPDDLKKLLHYDPAALAAAAATPTALTRLLDGKLVNSDGKDVTAPKGDVHYYLLYFSAGWCPPCHAMTPHLVSWYNGFKPEHPNFEIILISNDHSEQDMYAYMKEMAMPWPAVRYKDIQDSGLLKYSLQTIPHIEIIDSNGTVLASNPSLEELVQIIGGT